MHSLCTYVTCMYFSMYYVWEPMVINHNTAVNPHARMIPEEKNLNTK